jgi:hypothetical protein
MFYVREAALIAATGFIALLIMIPIWTVEVMKIIAREFVIQTTYDGRRDKFWNDDWGHQ